MNTNTVRVLVALLAVFLITTISTAVYHMTINKYKTETAIMYSVADKISFNGVYVRDEEVIDYSGNGAVSYDIADGGKVAKNSVVAEIYNNEQAIETKQKITELQRQLEVLKKIQNPGTTEVAQPAFISNLISEHYKNIAYNKEFGNMEQVRSDEEQLLVLLSIMQIVTGESDSFDSKISEIQTEIDTLQAQLTDPIDTITSKDAAYFVSYVDGYENMLSKENISKLSVEDIEGIKDGNNSSDIKGIGKFVYGYQWDLVGVIDNSKKVLAEGDKVTINFESTSTQVTATVSDIRDSNDPQKSIITFDCAKLTSDLVQHRVEKVEIIKKEYRGIKVPRSAIRFKDVEVEEDNSQSTTEISTDTAVTTATTTPVTENSNTGDAKMERVRGVYVKLGEKIIFRKIEVIYEGDDYVVAALNNEDADYLMLYDDIITEGVE